VPNALLQTIFFGDFAHWVRPLYRERTKTESKLKHTKSKNEAKFHVYFAKNTVK